MTGKTKSFDEFFYRKRDDIFNVDIVVGYSDSHDGDTSPFNKEMFCPECYKAELSFVHKTLRRRAHLRHNSRGGTKHKEGCSYNYDYASKRVVQKYVDSLSYDELHDKLNSIINMLCKSPNIDYGSSGTGQKESQDNPMLIPDSSHNGSILKQLRRKSLNSWVDEADKNELFIFYGKVKLKVVEKEKKTDDLEGSYKYNVLEVYCFDKNERWKFRTSLLRGRTQDSINEDAVYYIAIIGRVGDKSWRIEMDNKQAVRYREHK